MNLRRKENMPAAQIDLLRHVWRTTSARVRRQWLGELLVPNTRLEVAPDELRGLRSFRQACVVDAADGRIKARSMYIAYVAWAKTSGRTPISETRFGLQMKKLIRRDDRGAIRHYLNVSLRKDRDGS
jgi:hypothetical protein